MTIEPDTPLHLVADVGGTNTRCALAHGASVRPDTVRRYANRDFGSLSAVLARFRADAGCAPPDGACIAVAGPVANGVAELTNLEWSIDTARLLAATGAASGAILNDLQAQGYALGHIAEHCIRSVIRATARPGAPQLVVNVGTGFNVAPVYPTPAGRIVPASEAGHANLPVRTEAELRLLNFVATTHGFPAVEDVLSGRGLSAVYRWLAAEAGEDTERSGAEIVAALESPGSDPRAEAAARQFVRIMGTVAGNLSLIHLPFGGVFLVGGVARAMAPYLGPMGFADAYRDKGRFAGFMQNFPVHLVEDDFAALTGCAAHLAERAAGLTVGTGASGPGYN